MATGTAGENEKPRILSTSSRKLATVNLVCHPIQDSFSLMSLQAPCMPPEGGVPPRFHAVLGTRGTVIVGAEATLKPKIDISTSGARSAIIVGANAISGRLKPKVDFLTSGGRGTVIVGLNPKIDILTSGARGTVIVGLNDISLILPTALGARGTVIVGLNDVPLMLPTALGARGAVIVGANAISGPLKPKIDVLTSGCYPDAPLRARCSRDHHRPPQCDFRGVPPRLRTALGARSAIIVSANAISGATLAQNRYFDLRVFL
ncbi:hypothetical protein B0H14DRAFT_2654247 [Mycena olivaceomarginata]|nr:hypothetical protein B0H14DRAFT_2654247 [Mycena olivaceomarginata]